MNMKRSIVLAASLTALLATTACKREATGQVVAVVDGEEITAQEINAEIAGKVPPKVDVKEVQRQTLQQIIERRLIAKAARDDGIEKDQEFLLRQRQVNDALLIQMLGQRTDRTFRIPDTAEITKYMAAHPNIFAQRQILMTDRIAIPTPVDMQKVSAIKADHSMEAVAARLTALNIKFKRDTAPLDTAALPPEVLNRIHNLPPGEPFVIPQPGNLMILLVTGSTPQPVGIDEARPVVVQLMRKEAVGKALQQRLKTEKAAAKIEYQPGFAPSKPDKS